MQLKMLPAFCRSGPPNHTHQVTRQQSELLHGLGHVASQQFCCCVMTLRGVIKASHVVFTNVMNLASCSGLWLTVTCAQTFCDLINHNTVTQAAGFILSLCFLVPRDSTYVHLSLVLLVLSHQAVRTLHKMSQAVRMHRVGHY